LAGSKAGCLAALLFGIFSSGPRIEGGGVNTEIFMVLPYTLAAYSLLRAVESDEQKHYLLFGLWTGLASTIKQVALVNLFWLGAYLVFYVWRTRNREASAHALRAVVLGAFGATLAWIPYCLYFYLKDAFYHFYYWQVSFNLDYMAEGHAALPNLAIFWHQTRDILGENGILWLLALAGIAWQWQELRKSRALGLGSSTGDHQVSAYFIMSTWPLFSFLGVSLGGHFYGHYYIQIIPALAVLGGVGLVRLSGQVRLHGIEILRSPISLVLTLLFAKALLLFVITDAPYYLSYNADQISLHQYRTPLFSVTRFIGKYLQQHTQPDELVYVWATNPEINFYALRKTPSPFLVQRRESRVPIEEVIQSLEKSPPKYIVVIDKMKRFPQLQEYIRQNYQEETDTEVDELKKLLAFNLYRRKEG
jgi:4-amino-4-deoxy-L-arabinose transferase-like glycosyltransferase